MKFSKQRLQKLAGLLTEEKKKTINEEVQRPETYSELEDWLDRRPATSKKVVELRDKEGEEKAADWLFSNFDDELSTWPGDELLQFLRRYSLPDYGDQNEEEYDYDDEDNYNDSMDGDFDSGMASAGFGTDEDYGSFGGNDW